MLPFLNLLPFFLLLITSTLRMPTSVSQGLTMKLIPPTSPESPFYGSLSSHQRAYQFICRSQARASHLSNTSIGPEEVARPPLEIKQLGLHAIKIGIGTFGPSKNSTYKSYYLVMDTGSRLVWLQCDGCRTKSSNKCFIQKDPPFPSTTSVTYSPLKCTLRDPKPCGSHKCDGKFCKYDITYADGSHSEGTLAKDKFTFDSHPQGQHTKNYIRFGCGIDQSGISFVKNYPGNQIAGVLGLGWDRDALHMQLDSQTNSKFSYCLQSQHSPPHESYLKFGSDIEMTSDFQKTPLHKDDVKYWVNLIDISINGKRLRLPFTWTNKVILDSGADASSLHGPIYQALEKGLARYFKRDGRVEKKPAQDEICYSWKRVVRIRPRHEYDLLPTITLHFQGGANFVIKPDGVFSAEVDEKGKPFFCLFIARNKPYVKENVLGVYQQTNHRMVFDLNKKMLHFKSQDC